MRRAARPRETHIFDTDAAGRLDPMSEQAAAHHHQKATQQQPVADSQGVASA
jgi:hypothetical protein